MKNILIGSVILVIGLTVTSCSSNDDEIQKTLTATVAIQNAAIDYSNIESIQAGDSLTAPKQAYTNDGVDDATNPPKKP